MGIGKGKSGKAERENIENLELRLLRFDGHWLRVKNESSSDERSQTTS
jgi:hypothetical protein